MYKNNNTLMYYWMGAFPAISMEGSDYFYTLTLDFYLYEDTDTFDSDYGYAFSMYVCVDDGTADTPLNCV